MNGKFFSHLIRCAALAALLAGGMAVAQMTPQQHQQYLNEIGQYHQQNRQRQQSNNSQASAAEIRAWEAREAEIQARIARHRATPYWLAIINDFANNSMGWAGGYSSEQRAVEEAMRHCRSANCKVLATFSNACAVVVGATNTPRSEKDFFIGIDKNDSVAAAEAWQACQAVHGDREDRCFYSSAQTQNGTAFCTGYDYSVYGHE